MNRPDEFRAALMLLVTGWPGQMGKDQLAVYSEMLADIAPGELADVIRGLLLTSEYRPSIAQIRRTVVERRELVPTLAAALAEMQALEDWSWRTEVAQGAGMTPDPRPRVHPLVQQTFDEVGPHGLPGVLSARLRDGRQRAIEAATECSLDQPRMLGGGRD